MTRTAIAFMSYAHVADDFDSRYLDGLRKSLANEVRRHTGNDFYVFLSPDIEWGETWRDRIRETIDAATFLIPVIAPIYFRRAECRRELEQFLAHEVALGHPGKLILPLSYIRVPEMTGDTVLADRLMREIAKRQIFDWTDLRFEDLTSPGVRRGVNKLASAICDLIARLGTVPERPGSGPAVSEVAEPWPVCAEPHVPEAPAPEPTGLEPAVVPPVIDVFQHFCVAREIENEEQFVGRQDEIRRGMGALRSDGASIVIFGFAGVGKTSLAMQLAHIASGGQGALIRKLGLETYRPPGGFAMPVVYYACRRDVDVDLRSTTLSLLLDCSGRFSLGSLLAEDRIRLALETPAGRQVLAQLDKVRKLGRCEEAANHAEHTFANLCSQIAQACGQRAVVVVIDEFNVIGDKTGFASQIKNRHDICFVLVGTGPDVRVLMKEHESVPRQIVEGQIRVHPMKRDEVATLLKVEEVRGGRRFRFNADAVDGIVSASHGFPFFVHFFGRYSLDQAVRRHLAYSVGAGARVEVTKEDVRSAMHERLRDLADLESRYVKTIDNRWEREAVLKLFACRDENEIPVGNIDYYARTVFGVKNVNTQIAQLTRALVLERTARSHYMFTDARMKIYTRLAQPICEETRRRFEHFAGEHIENAAAEGWVFPLRS